MRHRREYEVLQPVRLAQRLRVLQLRGEPRALHAERGVVRQRLQERALRLVEREPPPVVAHEAQHAHRVAVRAERHERVARRAGEDLLHALRALLGGVRGRPRRRRAHASPERVVGA